jgi:hypothetical protein
MKADEPQQLLSAILAILTELGVGALNQIREEFNAKAMAMYSYQ